MRRHNLSTLPAQDVKAFGRIFVHPQYGFAANIMAARAETQNAARQTTVAMRPLQIAIISLFGRDENYWPYATSNHKPDPYSEWHQSPHELIRRVGASAHELFQIRQQTVGKLRSKIPALETPFRSAEDYMKYEEISGDKIRENYARKTVWEATRQLVTFKFRHYNEYWGTLGQKPV